MSITLSKDNRTFHIPLCLEKYAILIEFTGKYWFPGHAYFENMTKTFRLLRHSYINENSVPPHEELQNDSLILPNITLMIKKDALLKLQDIEYVTADWDDLFQVFKYIKYKNIVKMLIGGFPECSLSLSANSSANITLIFHNTDTDLYPSARVLVAKQDLLKYSHSVEIFNVKREIIVPISCSKTVAVLIVRLIQDGNTTTIADTINSLPVDDIVEFLQAINYLGLKLNI